MKFKEKISGKITFRERKELNVFLCYRFVYANSHKMYLSMSIFHFSIFVQVKRR